MNKKSFLLLMLFTLCSAFTAVAQIGYQVALLTTATGQPRAGETVNATVTLTNKESTVIYTGTQKATTNDFGILSLTIGDADTFKNVDWSKLPLYISVSVDGVLIGKSQVLSVPVAETAKSVAPAFDLNDLLGTWEYSWRGNGQIDGVSYENALFVRKIIFQDDGIVLFQELVNGNCYDSEIGFYSILGNVVCAVWKNSEILLYIKDHKVFGMGSYVHK